MKDRLYYVRSYFIEENELVHLDEGPWEYYLAMLVISDIGIDASVPRGLGRVQVVKAKLIQL